MRAVAWVIGSSGLLGSALVRALRQADYVVHRPDVPFSWREFEQVKAQIEREARAFEKSVRAFGHWTVFWAAGVGSMASHPDSLVAEEHIFLTLLEALKNQSALREIPGTFVFASSAGALYGGSRAACYSESSALVPTTAYARHKLRQEEHVRAFAAGDRSLSGLILRYSTLYGIGQARDKPQGLITQIARRIVANEPVHIYVPLDTIRDYLHADDAAQRSLATLRDARYRGGQTTIKIIASERATSIAQLIGVFQRLSRRRPRIVTATNSLSARYMRCAQFLSEELAGKPDIPGRTLLVGIHEVLEAERMARARAT
jgi:UDP-glucose 4-epimerase